MLCFQELRGRVSEVIGNCARSTAGRKPPPPNLTGGHKRPYMKARSSSDSGGLLDSRGSAPRQRAYHLQKVRSAIAANGLINSGRRTPIAQSTRAWAESLIAARAMCGSAAAISDAIATS